MCKQSAATHNVTKQVSKLAAPKYATVGDAVKGFTATLQAPDCVEGGVDLWEGHGRTRKDAEMACAVRACEHLVLLGLLRPKAKGKPRSTTPVPSVHAILPPLPVLVANGDEPFVANPKSALAHCWQARGIGQPVYNDTSEYVPPPLAIHAQIAELARDVTRYTADIRRIVAGVFEARVPLPAQLVETIRVCILRGQAWPETPSHIASRLRPAPRCG